MKLELSVNYQLPSTSPSVSTLGAEHFYLCFCFIHVQLHTSAYEATQCTTDNSSCSLKSQPPMLFSGKKVRPKMNNSHIKIGHHFLLNTLIAALNIKEYPSVSIYFLVSSIEPPDTSKSALFG